MTQNPDTFAESILGSGNVPGYRGLAYIVFESLQLASFGNRLPNLTFEICADTGVRQSRMARRRRCRNRSAPANRARQRHAADRYRRQQHRSGTDAGRRLSKSRLKLRFRGGGI